MFQAKISILYSLLAKNPANKPGIDLLKKTVSEAERNNLLHGFVFHLPDPKIFTLIRRTVREQYKVSAEPLDMAPHLNKFMASVDVVQAYFSLTEMDVDNYGKSILADA